MTPNVAAIAAGLSPAQRQALLRHMEYQAWGDRSDHYFAWPDVGHGLKKIGLIEFPDDISGLTIITPLGLAVRAHILEDTSHE